jgi:LysM repeat protein
MGVKPVIETIYSNESGEGSLSGRVQPVFKMPKNVRQIGKSNSNKKIYVEDYVMTFIKQLAGGDFSKCRIAVLVGQCIRLDSCRNIFISGAVEVKDIDPTTEITFSNDHWNTIYEEIKKYFVETEIVGWFIGGPGYLIDDKEKITKAHINNFAGQDKTLLTYDNVEKEEAFYSYENNRLTRQEGFYIYYEKNDEMQNYMIEHKASPQSNEADYDDRVSRDMRVILQNKKTPQEESKNINRLMYAAGTLLAVIVLVVGAAILNNYDQMKSMQDTLNYLSQNMEEVQAIFSEGRNAASIKDGTTLIGGQSSDAADVENDGDSKGDSLDIEDVPGDVERLPEEEKQDEDSAPDEDLVGDEEDKENNKKQEEVPDKKSDDGKNKDEDRDTSEKSEKKEVVKTEVKYYIVQEGDTLADISYKLYHTYTKVKKIMELNQLEDQDIIYVGQKLIVP